MNRKRKLAIVLPYFGTGGAEKMVSQLAAAMDPDAFETEVFCIYGGPQGNHMEQALQDRGVPIHYIGKKLGFSVRAIFRLFQKLDTFGPDVVHTHLYACMYAFLWPLLRRKVFLHTFHTLPEVENRRLSRRLLTRCLVRGKKMIPVAISKGIRGMVADYYGIPAERVELVQNPVDVRRFASGRRKDDGVFRFITVGRLSPVKNQQMIIRAFAEFLEHGLDGRLLVLGKGSEEASLKALAEERRISDRIDYAGYVDNVEDYLKTADVFLLSSHYEAQPLSILEAMAAGLPVISTDVGGIRDIVTDNGILVPPDDVQAMAQAMVQLRTDELLRQELAGRAAANAQAYDLSHTVAGYSELYRRYEGGKKRVRIHE